MRASLKLPRLGGDAAKMELPLCLRPASEHDCATHKRPQTRDNITTARTGTLELDWREAGMCESRTSVALRSCGPARLPQLMVLRTRGHISAFSYASDTASWWCLHQAYANKGHRLPQSHNLQTQGKPSTQTVKGFPIFSLGRSMHRHRLIPLRSVANQKH